MKINVDIKLNTDFLKKIDNAKNKALERTVQWGLDDIKTRGVVPKDTGELERSGYVELYGMKVNSLVARIIFDTPYARRWYFNVDDVTFQKTKNPNAQDHWMDYYLDGNGKQELIDTYTQFLKEESDGLIK